MRPYGKALLLALAAACVLSGYSTASTTATATTPARASADWIGWKFLGTKCIDTPEGERYAHVRVRMIVHNGGAGPHWATNMRVKARLVPTGSGLNLPRSWRTTRFPVHSDLLQDTSYAHDMAVNTDVMSPEADWRVQVKLIWDRKLPFHDVVKKFSFPFKTDKCTPGKTHSGPIVGIPGS
jgi:hypothetical protein